MSDQPIIVTGPRATTAFWKKARAAGGLPYKHELAPCAGCGQLCVLAPSSSEVLANGATLVCWDVCWPVLQREVDNVSLISPPGQKQELLAVEAQMRRN